MIEKLSFIQMIENLFIGDSCVLFATLAICVVVGAVALRYFVITTDEADSALLGGIVSVGLACLILMFLLGIAGCFTEPAVAVRPIASTYALNTDTIALEVVSRDPWITKRSVENCNVTLAYGTNVILNADGTFSTADDKCGFVRFQSALHSEDLNSVVHLQADECTCENIEHSASVSMYAPDSLYREWLDEQSEDKYADWTHVPLDGETITLSIESAVERVD